MGRVDLKHRDPDPPAADLVSIVWEVMAKLVLEDAVHRPPNPQTPWNLVKDRVDHAHQLIRTCVAQQNKKSYPCSMFS